MSDDATRPAAPEPRELVMRDELASTWIDCFADPIVLRSQWAAAMLRNCGEGAVHRARPLVTAMKVAAMALSSARTEGKGWKALALYAMRLHECVSRLESRVWKELARMGAAEDLSDLKAKWRDSDGELPIEVTATTGGPVG